MEKQTRYNELLGISNAIRDPDLYQLLGIDRAAFDAAEVEERYRERMSTLQGIKSPKHKSFIEFLKGELRRARSTLCDERQRAAYDDELLVERREQLTRILDIVLADGSLAAVEEERIHALALEVGLSSSETGTILDEELQSRGARREAAGGVWREPVTPGIAPLAPGDTAWLDAIAPATPPPGRAATAGDVRDAIARRMAPPTSSKRRPPPPPIDDDEVVAELVDSGELERDDPRVRHLVGSDDLLPTLMDSGEAVMAELVDSGSGEAVVPELVDSPVRAPEPTWVPRVAPRTGALARRDDLQPLAPATPPPLRAPTPDRGARSTDKQLQQPAAKATDRHAQPPAAKSTDRQAQTPTTKATDRHAQTPSAKSTERRAQSPTAKGTDRHAQTPAAKATDRHEQRPARPATPAAPPPLETKPRPRAATGWGKAAVDRPAGVCSSCLGEIGELELTTEKAERTDEGRLHCPKCKDLLVAGIICCACYQRITRTDMKGGQLKVSATRRVAHGHCAR